MQFVRACLATGILLSIACKTPFTVNEYPLITEAPDRLAGGQQQQQEVVSDRSRYWSAYVYVDPENVASLWSSNKRTDYILISARASLPTYEGVLVRDFPLFSIKRGNAKAHSGIDLFYKYPINFSARDQVAFEIEVQYLKNEAALDIARKVIEQVEAIAKPFLENYPLATEIISGGKKIVGSLVETAETPSSYKFSLSEADLDKIKLKTFILEEMLDTTETAKQRSADRLAGVRSCADKPGALCRCKGTTPATTAACKYEYSKDRVTDFVYLTLRIARDYDVFDPRIMIGKGVFACNQITAPAIEVAQNHLKENKYMFTPQDIGYALDAYERAEAYVQARALISGGKFAQLLDLLNTNIMEIEENVRSSIQAPPSEPLADHWNGVQECLKNVWEQSPGAEVLQAWLVFKQRMKCDAVPRTKCRLDAIGSMLNRMARLNGLSFDASRPTGERQGVVFDLLAHEAAALHAVQKEEIRGWAALEGNCKDEMITKKFSESISPYCTECVEIVAEKCPKSSVRSLVAAQRDAVDKAELQKSTEAVSTIRTKWDKGNPTTPSPQEQDQPAGD